MGLKRISSLVKFPFYFTVGEKRVERAFRSLPSHSNQQEALPRGASPGTSVVGESAVPARPCWTTQEVRS